MASKEHDDVPDSISENDEACAYYGVTRQLFTGYEIAVTDEILCELSLAIQTALEQEKIVDFWYNELAKNKTIGHIDDFFFDVMKGDHGIELSETQMNEIIEKTMHIAKNRRA